MKQTEELMQFDTNKYAMQDWGHRADWLGGHRVAAFPTANYPKSGENSIVNATITYLQKIRNWF